MTQESDAESKLEEDFPAEPVECQPQGTESQESSGVIQHRYHLNNWRSQMMMISGFQIYPGK